jgi:hypothetical protein
MVERRRYTGGKKRGPKGPNSGSFKEGHDDKRKNNGRPLGAKNRIPTQVKEAILEAMTIAGGDQGMVGYFLQVIQNYELGARLAEKVMPMQITGPNDGPVQMVNIPIEEMRKMDTDELHLLGKILKKLGGIAETANHPTPLLIEHQPLGDAGAYAKEIGVAQKSKNNGSTKH